MAQRPKGYGMTAELQRKKDGKHDPALEKEALDFIESRTGRSCSAPIDKCLHDGVTLCHLANALKPGSVKKINESKMAFKKMENIGNFLLAVESLGVAKTDLFQTVDLYESQNVPQFVITNNDFVALYSMRNISDEVVNGILSIKRKVTGGESTKNVRHFTDEQMKAGQNIIGLQMGTNKGASQKGMSAHGAVRQIRHEDNMDRS